MQTKEKTSALHCYHCGETCDKKIVKFEDHVFCCDGCRTVYEILQQNQLCDFYNFDEVQANKPKAFTKEKWLFLDAAEIQQQLLQFSSAKRNIMTLHIPGMHCTSCIYLLENLSRIKKGVIATEVNFLKKEFTIQYDPKNLTLRELVETLCTIGYSPSISLQDAENKQEKQSNKKLYYKIGVAAFCASNLMILGLPDYFDFNNLLTSDFKLLFNSLSAVLALPVIFYSGAEYFKSGFYALKNRTVNMDLPVALGLSGLIIQSYYDVFTHSGPGFFDSIAMFIFMLLVGRFFQQRTYQAFSFDRDFKSYFPLAVTKIVVDKKQSAKVTTLQKNDVIFIHNEELIPADSVLESESAMIDYSFVTGESEPVNSPIGQLIYAGGRNKGSGIQLRVAQPVSQSYLTQLWNAKAFSKQRATTLHEWSNKLARYFTIAVILIAAATAIYWKINDSNLLLKAVTSALIVACPCVLALSIPFTFGAVLRIFGRNGLYLKNADAIEELAKTDTIIFDKTGTLTSAQATEIMYEGEDFSAYERSIIGSVAANSTHPVSKKISEKLEAENKYKITNWEETIGQGISAEIDNHKVAIGKNAYIGLPENASIHQNTFVSVDGKLKGKFTIQNTFRKDIEKLALQLRKGFKVLVLSGDSDRDKLKLSSLFGATNLYFNQSPKDKLDFIEKLQKKGSKVTMIGDGLNDAGALKAANFGITITDDVNAFTPASDAILEAKNLGLLPQFVKLAKSTRSMIYGSFIFSFAYNCVGLSFAVRGELEPWVAALLMPISSVTVLLYTQLVSRFLAKKYKL
ncbi:MAG: HAD family hydrolase [Sphingobacteriales bacterium]|nr:MAG: HAD family hydrolase [Sphingobacteriales bacterium]